jgi:hypothetical protein
MAMFGLKLLYVYFHVMGQWMSGWQVFCVDEDAAAGAVTLDDAAPTGIWYESEFSFDDGLVHFFGIKIPNQTALFEITRCRTDIMVAVVALPSLLLKVDIQVFGNLNFY